MKSYHFMKLFIQTKKRKKKYCVGKGLDLKFSESKMNHLNWLDLV